MDLFFGTTHLETLMDLKAIAEKHNAKLNFGFDNYSNPDMDYDLLKTEKVHKKVIEFLEENYYSIKNITHSYSKIWFEICEKMENEHVKYHTMAYIKQYLYFNLDAPDIDYELDNATPKTRELVEEFLHNTDYDGFYSFSDSPTVITGFGNEKRITDYRVYRSGMALKYFADLVCDYFKEPRIERNY